MNNNNNDNDNNLSKKKSRKIRRKNQENHVKIVEFSYRLTQNLQQQNQFYIFGDTVIDIDQLLYLKQVKFISAHNNFRRSISISRNRELDLVEAILDTSVRGQTNLLPIILMLNSLKTQEFSYLSSIIQNYHNLINQSIDINQYYQSLNSLISDDQHCKKEDLSNNNWNYQKSLERAQDSINKMHDQCKNTNAFFSYMIMKGNKFEQIKSIVSTPLIFLRDFMCMNDDQIDFLLLRQPIVFPTFTINQYLDQTVKRVHELIYQFKLNENNFEDFRSGPVKVTSRDFDIKSVDNLKVSFDCEGYIHVLSNYEHKKDDLIYFFKFIPKGSFKAQDIIQSQRNLRKEVQENTIYPNFCYQKKQTNEKDESDQQFVQPTTYIDIRYSAQSEIFKERFYSMVENEAFHEINSFF